MDHQYVLMRAPIRFLPFLFLIALLTSCVNNQTSQPTYTIEYYHLRPAYETKYGYSAAVRVGRELKIDVVSQNEAGEPIGEGDMKEQMKNCYADVQRILDHFGYTFDDIVVEDIYTTDMAELNKTGEYHNSFFGKHYPAGVWVEVKGLASPKYMIEIKIEARRQERD